MFFWSLKYFSGFSSWNHPPSSREPLVGNYRIKQIGCEGFSFCNKVQLRNLLGAWFLWFRVLFLCPCLWRSKINGFSEMSMSASIDFWRFNTQSFRQKNWRRENKLWLVLGLMNHHIWSDIFSNFFENIRKCVFDKTVCRHSKQRSKSENSRFLHPKGP